MDIESFFTGFLAEFLAGFIGIFIGLRAEKWWEDRQEQKTIEDILPYIYVELCENLLLFEGDEANTVNNYWSVYRYILAKWNNPNLMKIIKIYELLDRVDKDKEHMDEASSLITGVLKYFDNKLIQDNNLLEKYEKAYEEFYSTQEDRYLTNSPYIPYFISLNQRRAGRAPP